MTIRRWRVEDGREIGEPMNARETVSRVAVSRDGRWVVSGSGSGMVAIWDAESHQKVTEFKAHDGWVRAVDVSPDGSKIATGSNDKTARVCSLSTGQRLLGPWQHDGRLAAVKFSLDGRLIATATEYGPIRMYDSQDGRLLIDIPFKTTLSTHCLAWASNSNCLFALSCDGNIHCLDAPNGTTLSKWPIYTNNPRLMSLARNGKSIAVCSGSSISLWDTTTHKQIGPLIQLSDWVGCMDISADYILVTGGIKITIRSLRGILPHDDDTTTESLGVEHSNNKIASPEEFTKQLPDQVSDAQRAFDQKENHLNETIQSPNSKIAELEDSVQQLRTQLAESQQKADERDGLLRIIRAHEHKHQCEVLYAKGHTINAANSLLEITNTLTEDVTANNFIMDWLAEFTNRCISKLECIGDERSAAGHHYEALSSYFTALLLSPSAPNILLTKWANIVLIRGSANDALGAATRFKLPRFSIYRVICDTLDRDDHVTGATECFQQMRNELGEDANAHDERAQWEQEFRRRCVDKLEMLGDAAMESKEHDAANGHYTTALTLGSTKQCDILLKRSEARTLMRLWEKAALDADKAIELDPSSPRGYESRRVALLGARRYDEAVDAYNEMLLKIEQSPSPLIRESRNYYASPSDTVAAIRNSVKEQLRGAPLVVINTETGRLRDAHERIAEFEADPSFKELVATMTRVDHDRIAQTVQAYFRYATFSHTWEGAEPLYNDIRDEPIHKLPLSPTFSKLLMFVKIAQEAGLRWAWSDICCINKADDSVLEESLKSMFKWYQGSSLTIVHLQGVLSDSDLLDLINCLWNTRVWTLQEYLASRVIRFYTEDWKPYLPHEIIHNHKESTTIINQMAAATDIDAAILLSLSPGSDNVRQKLSLAAARAATEPEDMAYSLFGIFNVSLSVAYGEGQEWALGRLLEEVLSRSGDVTILAWTGKASEYNSFLPAEIAVYRDPVSPYIPSPMEESELNALVTELQTSSAGILDSALMLYNLIKHLLPPRLVSQRLTLSCIVFPLRNSLISNGGSQRVYRTKTHGLGTIVIKTAEDLSDMEHLILVHPWPKYLADPDDLFEDLDEEDDAEPLTPLDSTDGDDNPDVPSPSPSPIVPTPSQSSQSRLDRRTRALRLFARLRQPFGAFLLVPLSNTEYKRVASDNPIIVQLSKNMTPVHLVQKIRHLEIL